MIKIERDVNLISYLPPYLKEFREIAATLNAEDPEFVLLWDACNKILYNLFIETADSDGIARYEKMFNILPSAEDTLESRRSRVSAKWFNAANGSTNVLISKLQNLCGDNFEIKTDYSHYRFIIITDLELFGQVEELENIVKTIVPCNMVVDCENIIPCISTGAIFAAGGVCTVDEYTLITD